MKTLVETSNLDDTPMSVVHDTLCEHKPIQQLALQHHSEEDLDYLAFADIFTDLIYLNETFWFFPVCLVTHMWPTWPKRHGFPADFMIWYQVYILDSY